MLPAAVFSDAVLADGTWADVLFSAAQARKPLPVIVVSRITDIRLYIRALENGAADFIVPPFGVPEITDVLRCVTGNGERLWAIAPQQRRTEQVWKSTAMLKTFWNQQPRLLVLTSGVMAPSAGARKFVRNGRIGSANKRRRAVRVDCRGSSFLL
jgi:FixJ family two-component response regulator